MQGNLQVDRSRLPDATTKQMDFLESSYFKSSRRHRGLPTPAEVRARSPRPASSQPAPVKFENLNLIVKFGPHVSVVEAVNLWLIREMLTHEVPVPEVYGWRVDGHLVFIYMQLIQGPTLKDKWSSLTSSDKTAVCNHLSQIMRSLRQLEQTPNHSFIGSVNHQSSQDYIFEDFPPHQPFTIIKQFNDWFSRLPQRRVPSSARCKDPYRWGLPDTGTIKFTHANLHRANIIITPTGPPRILAVVDWGQSGWYPDYWEYCKACYTAADTEEWCARWIPKFLNQRTDECSAFRNYIMWIGAV